MAGLKILMKFNDDLYITQIIKSSVNEYYEYKDKKY